MSKKYIVIEREQYKDYIVKLLSAKNNPNELKLVIVDMAELLDKENKQAKGQVQAKINQNNELEV